MELADQEARALYSEQSVREYIRERVQVELLDTGEVVEAYCYNLPRESSLAGANPAYAAALSQLVEALRFDSAYVEEIAAFGEQIQRAAHLGSVVLAGDVNLDVISIDRADYSKRVVCLRSACGLEKQAAEDCCSV